MCLRKVKATVAVFGIREHMCLSSLRLKAHRNLESQWPVIMGWAMLGSGAQLFWATWLSRECRVSKLLGARFRSFGIWQQGPNLATDTLLSHKSNKSSISRRRMASNGLQAVTVRDRREPVLFLMASPLRNCKPLN